MEGHRNNSNTKSALFNSSYIPIIQQRHTHQPPYWVCIRVLTCNTRNKTSSYTCTHSRSSKSSISFHTLSLPHPVPSTPCPFHTLSLPHPVPSTLSHWHAPNISIQITGPWRANFFCYVEILEYETAVIYRPWPLKTGITRKCTLHEADSNSNAGC
jgi:hypothetical protein